MKDQETEPATLWGEFKQHPFRAVGLSVVMLAIATFLLFSAVYTINSVFNSVFRRCIAGAETCVDSADTNGPTKVCWCAKGLYWVWEKDPTVNK